MNGADLTIIDKINDVNFNFFYRFYKLTTYKNLLNDLPNIYSKFNSKFNVIFTFQDLNNNYVVTNLNNYILIGDKINIIFKIYKNIYFLYDFYSKKILKKSYDIKELYKIYFDLYKTINNEILLYKKIGCKVKLIDVLDSPNNYKNKCINRLVKNYNY